MEALEKLLEIFRKYGTVIHQEKYEQFTIDFIQDNEMDIGWLTDEECSESEAGNIIGDIQYQISCILKIIKEGKDKALFQNLESDLTKIEMK